VRERESTFPTVVSLLCLSTANVPEKLNHLVRDGLTFILYREISEF